MPLVIEADTTFAPVVQIRNEELIKALKLSDGDYLLKAAILLFYQDPEKWCLGSYVKIGYFKNDADLIYQDEINGSLIGITDRIIETIFTKYFIGLIRYEGLQRIDEYPMPREVLREAILNAVVHKDYSTGNPIHIKIYDDKVVIYNNCQIPSNIELDHLLSGIHSNPYNPLIANSFFRSGQIEAWGRGIEKMRNGCLADGLPEPEFSIKSNIFTICFQIRNNSKKMEETDASNFGVNSTQKKIVELMTTNPEIKTQEIADKLGLSKRMVEYSIRDLKKTGLVERVGSDKKGKWVVKKDA